MRGGTRERDDKSLRDLTDVDDEVVKDVNLVVEY